MSSKTGSLPCAAARPPFVRRRKLAALLSWLALLGCYQVYSWRGGFAPPEAARRLVDLMSNGEAGWLIYVGFYALSRLVFFPPTLLTVASGFVFGPALGVVLTVAGSNAAAGVSYLMGRYFGGGLLDPEKGSGAVRRHAERMRNNGFESVLLMRLIYAPFDLVSMLAGSLRVDCRQFVLATALGSLPCTLSLVLLGASIETGFANGAFGLDPRALLASAILFAGSLLVSRRLRRATASEEATG